jgi:hypothetical protein
VRLPGRVVDPQLQVRHRTACHLVGGRRCAGCGLRLQRLLLRG